MKRIVGLPAVVLLLVVGVALASWRLEQEKNKELCIDLARCILALREIERDATNTSTNLQVDAFASREHVTNASAILEKWRGDSAVKRRAVVVEMDRALGHYRRVSELYLQMARGGANGDAFAEFQVKLSSGQKALLHAAGVAVGLDGLSLTAARRGEIREFVEDIFAAEIRDIDRNRRNGSFTAGEDIWAIEMLRGTLNNP